MLHSKSGSVDDMVSFGDMFVVVLVVVSSYGSADNLTTVPSF